MVVAALGRDALQRVLPPLAIDADALGGAVTVVSVGVVLIGCAHLGVLIGVRRRDRRAASAGVLLGGLLAALCVGFVAAGVSSALRTPEYAIALYAAAGASGVGAVAYIATAVALAGEIRSGAVS